MLIVQTYHFFLLLQIAWSTHPIVNILCHSAFMLKIQCDCNGVREQIFSIVFHSDQPEKPILSSR